MTNNTDNSTTKKLRRFVMSSRVSTVLCKKHKKFSGLFIKMIFEVVDMQKSKTKEETIWPLMSLMMIRTGRLSLIRTKNKPQYSWSVLLTFLFYCFVFLSSQRRQLDTSMTSGCHLISNVLLCSAVCLCKSPHCGLVVPQNWHMFCMTDYRSLNCIYAV